MEILCDLDQLTRNQMDLSDGGFLAISLVAPVQVWVCGICGSETRGELDGDKSSPRVVFRTPVGAVCCALGEVAQSDRSLVGGHTTNCWLEDSWIYFEVHWAGHECDCGQGRHVL